MQDALLSNANRLLVAARSMLESEDVPLARSLAILGMEESGKAIALHWRRRQMAHAPEGEPFVNERLQDLWRKHNLKLETVHRFLVEEEYWFDVEPSDSAANERVLGTIDRWKRDHNDIKQRGFYVDVTANGDLVAPEQIADGAAVRAVVGHVHQIGWQLRLGEHIEGKRQLERSRDVPPASDDHIEEMQAWLSKLDSAMAADLIASMRAGTKGTKLNNESYAFVLPENPFQNIGRPGYEAEDRQLRALMEQVQAEAEADSPDES